MDENVIWKYICDSPKNYYEEMKFLELLRSEKSDLEIECLFALRSGHLSLKDLLTKHGENGVFVILEDLLSNNEMTENVLAQVLNQNLK